MKNQRIVIQLWLGLLILFSLSFSRLVFGFDLYAKGQLIYDHERKLTVEQVIDHYLSTPKYAPSAQLKNMDNTTYWLVAEVYNVNEPNNWVFTKLNPFFDQIDFYVFDDRQLISHQYHNRMAMATNEDLSIHLGYSFPFSLPQEESRLLVMRVQTTYFVDIIAEVQPAHLANNQQVKYQVIILLIMGIYIALIFYNLFLAIGIKELSHVWYSLYTGSFLFILLSIFGWLASLFGFLDEQWHGYIFALISIQLFGILFSYHFLKLPEVCPRLINLFKFLVFLNFLEIIIFFFIGLNLKLIHFIFFIYIIFNLMMALWAGYKKVDQALYIVIAQGIVLFSASSIILAGLEGFEYHIKTTLLGCFAIILQTFIFSLALADRVRLLQHEKLQAENINNVNSMFLVTMSDEIYSPLNEILDVAELLKRTSLSVDQYQYIQSIQDAGKKLLSIINDILILSKCETNKITIESVNFNPHLLFSEIVQILSPVAENKGLTISSQINSDVPTEMQGDPAKLRQILLNLGNNTIKYTEQGDIDLTLKLLNSKKNKDKLQFSISHGGDGIPVAIRSHLFHSFFQADSSISGCYDGNGLGLAVVKSLVNAMKGSIEYQSTEDKKSCFFVTISFNKKQQTESIVLNQNMVSSVPFVEMELAILVVDDEDINLSVTAGLLSYGGHKPSLVKKGHKALQMLKEQKFDLILMDIDMPEIDGVEIVRRLRARHDDTPVIALTAHVMKNEQVRYLAAGMNAILAKPVDSETLNQSVMDVVTNREGNQLNHKKDNQQRAYLDETTLQRHHEILGHQGLFNLLQRFEKSSVIHLHDINQAWGNKEREKLVQFAHGLSGIALTLGFPLLGDISAKVEYMAEDGSDHDLSGMIRLLHETHNHTVTIMNNYMAKH